MATDIYMLKMLKKNFYQGNRRPTEKEKNIKHHQHVKIKSKHISNKNVQIGNYTI
jgi:hypothetical protein